MQKENVVNNSVKLFKNQNFRIVEDCRYGCLVLYKIIWDEEPKQWVEKEFDDWKEFSVALLHLESSDKKFTVTSNGHKYFIKIDE